LGLRRASGRATHQRKEPSWKKKRRQQRTGDTGPNGEPRRAKQKRASTYRYSAMLMAVKQNRLKTSTVGSIFWHNWHRQQQRTKNHHSAHGSTANKNR
jgi:hypothetical protein